MVKGAPDGSERATIGELVDRLRLAQTTVTELVQRSVDAGLLVRERSESDSRVIYVRLSAEGERRLALVFQSHKAEREKLRAALGESQGEAEPIP
jgi:DNA-binding MarR family transcriptional regulator